MPFHKVPSGPNQEDMDVLEEAVKRIEAKGEEVVAPLLNWASYPIGQIVLITRKVPSKIVERRTKPAA